MTTTAVTVPLGATITAFVQGRTMVTATRTLFGHLRLTVATTTTGTLTMARSMRAITLHVTPFRAAVSWCSATGVSYI